MKLRDYINQHYLNQREFGRVQGVKPQQVTQWIDKGFIVVDGVLYSPRRDLRTPAKTQTVKPASQMGAEK